VIKNAAKDPPNRTYRHALECLAEAGPAAAAHWELLLDALSSEDVMTQRIAADGLERMLPGLGEDKWRALRAMEALRRPLDFSSVDDPATLVELLTLDDPLCDASRRLVALGPRASEALLDALDGDDPIRRGRAAQALLLIDARKAGEAAWRAALATPDAAFRLDDVCRAGPQDAIPHLMNALSSNDATARRTSAFLLKEVAHRDAAPAIRNLVVHDPDPDVRLSAIWALDALLAAP
jgi:HEAT repeat protein